MAQVGSIITSTIIVDNIKWYNSYEEISYELSSFFETLRILNVKVSSIHIEINEPTIAKIFYRSETIIPWEKIK